MKDLSKKSISITLIFILFMAIFMPTNVHAIANRVNHYTWVVNKTEYETVSADTDLLEYVMSKKHNISESADYNDEWLSFYGEFDGVYKYPKAEDGLTFVFNGEETIDGVRHLQYDIKYTEVIVTKEASDENLPAETSRVQVIMDGNSGNECGTFTISGGAFDGTVNHESSTAEFVDIGTKVNLTATPNNTYTFTGWYNCEEYDVTGDANLGVMGWRPIDNVLSTDNSYTFTVTNNYYNIMPVFESKAGHNNIWATSGGQIAVFYENRNAEQTNLDGDHWVDRGQVVDYMIGDPITVKAKANEGYHFVGWFQTDPKASVAEDYVREPVLSTEANYTYQPGVTIIDGVNEPINYITAVFEEDKKEKTYILDDEKENQIIFTDIEGIVFVFTSTDMLNMTEEELQAIADEMGANIESIRLMGSQILESARNAVKGKGTLVGLYDFSVYDGHNFKEEATGGFKIRIKMTDEMKKYNDFSIAFLKDDGTLDELIKLAINGDYLEGILPHLSTYAVIGNNVETTPTQIETTTSEEATPTVVEDTAAKETKTEESTSTNPKTGDNIVIWVGLALISMIGIVVTKYIS